MHIMKVLCKYFDIIDLKENYERGKIMSEIQTSDLNEQQERVLEKVKSTHSMTKRKFIQRMLLSPLAQP